MSVFRSKLPEDVLLHLKLKRGAEAKWNVTSLGDRSRDYVTARERAMKGNKINIDKSSNHGSGPRKLPVSNQGSMSSAKSSTQALTRDFRQQTSGASSSFEKKCRYCSGMHWSGECDKYKTISDRKAHIKGSCFKCLKEGNSYKECKTKRKCVYCGKMDIHHRSLCSV